MLRIGITRLLPFMQRKLTAILSADIVGFSGLMEADEDGTLARLKANRSAVFDPLVAAHGGRTVKLMGDGALVEFASVVAAVECALAVQERTAAAGPELRYRIGVNLGDVIVDGDDLYGDGVNIAARLQAIAPAGGVALSGTVRDHLAGKLDAAFEDLGEHKVKNIARPIRVYAVAAPKPADAATPEAPRRHAICVLPFTNMSGETEQEYFSDGITEDIITDLSKVSALWVASRNAAFAYKNKPVDVPEVARQLRVAHVLEGSVRKSGNRVRITAQLIDGVTNGHVWAERYDREMTDIFALQDEISKAIVAALSLKLLPEESRAIERRGTANPDAYNLYLMARQYHVGGSLGGVRRNEAIIRLAGRAAEIDPDYARAWALIAVAQVNLRFYFGRSGEDGLAAAERALSLDGELGEAHAARARVFMQGGRLAEARREVERALALDPESYEINSAAAHLAFTERRLADAVRHYEKASTLMETGYSAVAMLMTCYAGLGDSEGVRDAARRTLLRTEAVVAQEPDNGDAMGHMVGALANLGEVERAKDWAARALVLDPDNHNMRYNLACAFTMKLKEHDAALDMLEPLFERLQPEMVNWAKADPDLDALRDNPRFRNMIGAAENRLGVQG
jgi:adenylate cyclase